MESNLDKQELKNKIEEFCKSKHFEEPFIQEVITKFIEGHTELYGDVIPEKDLFKRLEDNLDEIVFTDPKRVSNGLLEQYVSRIADNTDVNKIFMYSNKTDLELSEIDKKLWDVYTESDKQKLLQDMQKRKSEIESTLMHALTHAAYTIKDKYGIGEKHIFSVTGTDYSLREYRVIGGTTNYVEAIVNYISNRIEGKNPDEIRTYKPETKAIYMLAEKMDEKLIIQAA